MTYGTCTCMTNDNKCRYKKQLSVPCIMSIIGMIKMTNKGDAVNKIWALDSFNVRNSVLF